MRLKGVGNVYLDDFFRPLEGNEKGSGVVSPGLTRN
jgi:hypothetical protein